MQIWQGVNIFAYFLGIFGGFLILLTAIKKFKQFQFKPFLTMGLGLFLSGFSFLFDLVSRFQVYEKFSFVFICLRIAIILFYLGNLLAVFSFFIVQSRVPWSRIVFYAVFYGMMIEINLSEDFSIFFDENNGLWMNSYANVNWFNFLYVLTSLPIFDIMFYVIQRHRLGFISNTARISIVLFWIGIFFPITALSFKYLNNAIQFSLSNLAFVTGLLCYAIAFLKEPLVFTLSAVKYYEIIIASSDEGNITIAQYAWMRGEPKEIKSQALSAVDALIDEMVRENPSERLSIQQIDLGKKKLIVERSPHFMAYMFVTDNDFSIMYGMKRILDLMEVQRTKKVRPPHEILDNEEFKKILRANFTFATSENKIQ